MIERIHAVGRNLNLVLNVDKCKVLVFERSDLVIQFVYLDSMMSRDGRIDREIERRVMRDVKYWVLWVCLLEM